MGDWAKSAPHSILRHGQLQIDGDTVFKLPLLGGDGFPMDSDSENVSARGIQHPILVKTGLRGGQK